MKYNLCLDKKTGYPAVLQAVPLHARKAPAVQNRVFRTVVVVLAVILILWGAVIFRRRTIVARRRRRLVGRNRISAIYEMSTAMYDMMVFSGAIENVSENDTEYADTVTESCSFIKGDEFTEFIKWVQAAVYGRVEPDDRQRDP